MIHFKAILKVMGGLMMLLGVLMFPSIAFSYYYQSGDQITLIGSALICLAVGGTFFTRLPIRTRISAKRRVHDRSNELGYHVCVWYDAICF